MDGDDERCRVALNCEREPGRSFCVPNTLLLLSTKHQAHYYCSALNTKNTTNAEHWALNATAYCHLHRLAIHKFVLSKNWRVNVIDIQRVYFADIQFHNRVLLLVISAISSNHCVHCTMYSVHPQSTSTPGSMAGIIAAEGASPSKHTSEQPVFMHQVQCHGKLCINKCFL